MNGRQARRAEVRRRHRRLITAALAASGAALLVGAAVMDGESDTSPVRTADSKAGGAVEVVDVDDPVVNVKEATNSPGGVGDDPGRTGLPARPPQGGELRTGGADEGCFETKADYIEAWDSTGKEPKPCFQPQPANGQDQPDDVQRSYNGERF